MSNKKQSADSVQKGPGLNGSYGSFRENTAPGIGSSGNTKSGSSQSNHRGKQSQ